MDPTISDAAAVLCDSVDADCVADQRDLDPTQATTGAMRP